MEKPGPGPGQKDFFWIKQGLDPKASYVIFEHDLNDRGESMTDPGQGVYAFLAAEGLSWEQVIDMDAAREYLVIRVNPGDEDRVLGRVLGFSETLVFYIFKAKEV